MKPGSHPFCELPSGFVILHHQLSDALILHLHIQFSVGGEHFRENFFVSIRRLLKAFFLSRDIRAPAHRREL